MHESGWTSSDTADQAKSEYKTFVNDHLLPNWPHSTYSDGIDMVLGKLMQSRTHLWEAVKFLSHGNSHVESGFLTNEQILDHNMKETLLVTQCVV